MKVGTVGARIGDCSRTAGLPSFCEAAVVGSDGALRRSAAGAPAGADGPDPASAAGAAPSRSAERDPSGMDLVSSARLTTSEPDSGSDAPVESIALDAGRGACISARRLTTHSRV